MQANENKLNWIVWKMSVGCDLRWHQAIHSAGRNSAESVLGKGFLAGVPRFEFAFVKLATALPASSEMQHFAVWASTFLIKFNWLIISQMYSTWIPFGSPLSALHNCFWVRVARTKRSATRWRGRAGPSAEFRKFPSERFVWSSHAQNVKCRRFPGRFKSWRIHVLWVIWNNQRNDMQMYANYTRAGLISSHRMGVSPKWRHRRITWL